MTDHHPSKEAFQAWFAQHDPYTQSQAENEEPEAASRLQAAWEGWKAATCFQKMPSGPEGDKTGHHGSFSKPLAAEEAKTPASNAQEEGVAQNEHYLEALDELWKMVPSDEPNEDPLYKMFLGFLDLIPADAIPGTSQDQNQDSKTEIKTR